MFGGVSHLAREPERPSEEFLISVVGPMTSIALAVVASAVLFWLSPRSWPWAAWNSSPVEMVVFLLAWGNLSVGIFNMIPGFPLDGGRVLRAIVWAGVRQPGQGDAGCSPVRTGSGIVDDRRRYRLRAEVWLDRRHLDGLRRHLSAVGGHQKLSQAGIGAMCRRRCRSWRQFT